MTDLGFLLARHGYDAVARDRTARGGADTYVSRLLGRRTVVLGDPDGARAFYDESLARRAGAVPPPLAWLLFGRGAVHGMDGTDEISIAGPTYVAALENGKVVQFTIKPEDAGLPEHPFGHILGGAPADNAAKLRAVLDNDPSPALRAFRDAILLNTAAALVVADRVQTLAEGVPLAAAALHDGRTRATLDGLIRVSRGG